MGRSLDTTVTFWPSLARFLATARMRLSLSPLRNPSGQHLRGDVVQLHHEDAAVVPDGDGLVQSAVLDPEVVEEPQGFAGEVAQFGVVAFSFQLGDDHDGDDDLVFGEAQQRAGIREQDGGVDHEGVDRESLPETAKPAAASVAAPVL